MFEPSKFKYKKFFNVRGKYAAGNSSVNNKLNFGSFGVKSLEHANLTAKQIETIYAITRKNLKKKGIVWFNVFPSIPVTKKPAEVRMGKGKGSVDHWISVIKPGKIILEIDGISLQDAQYIVKAISYKLSFKCKIISDFIGGII